MKLQQSNICSGSVIGQTWAKVIWSGTSTDLNWCHLNARLWLPRAPQGTVVKMVKRCPTFLNSLVCVCDLIREGVQNFFLNPSVNGGGGFPQNPYTQLLPKKSAMGGGENPPNLQTNPKSVKNRPKYSVFGWKIPKMVYNRCTRCNLRNLTHLPISTILTIFSF